MPGESFVFHRKVRAPLFGRHSDGTWFHYRDGRLLAQGSYAANHEDSALVAESRVLRARNGDAPGPRVLLTWFSHEIPATEVAGRPSPYTIRPFAEGLARLQTANDTTKPYALVVLSTCYGGNPEMLDALATLADRVVASPAYLHLSHLDVSAFAELPVHGPSEESLARFADTVAARSFARLRANARTEITVATYDTERIAPFLHAARGDDGNENSRSNSKHAEWVDCAHLPGFDTSLATRGTRLYYRPPQFGPGKDRAERSAWQCTR
jgi:hypothetical protein